MKTKERIVRVVRSISLSLGGLMVLGTFGYSPNADAAISCSRTVTADIVAIDQPIMFNRLGAQNVNYMVYALRRDVVNTDTNKPLTKGGDAVAGKVAMRPDKRPRPLVLRVAAGDCLQVNLQNLLTPNANPFNADPPILQINDQVAGRYVSFHPLGLELVNSIADDGSFVGNNDSSLLAPGASGIYTYYAPAEGAFMAYSRGQNMGGEASGGNVGVGLFGVVNVEPAQANFYRSKLNEEEMRIATSLPDGTPNLTALGQPIVNYEAIYPDTTPWIEEGKAGLPVLNMLTATNELVHADIDAVIVGPNNDGSFPASTYPLESQGLRNPTVPTRLEAFREFTVVFHDEQAATQAFPLWFGDPVLGHTLHGVRDSFMINYASGGIGSEIIANRLGVGPMQDCLNCAYEEFFLTAFTVGDIGVLVDNPANGGLELCDPALNNCVSDGLVATQAFFPDDPSNVHNSYMTDPVKFRQLHAGPKEQHIFHLHNHQWLFNANDDNSNYLDAQGIGPGSGYTMEIAFGGSGNRNMSAGDAIFHCHFYPHFAQGMWEMWRINDTFQTGTVLEASGGDADNPGFHTSPFALQNGRPAVGARAYPDGEIVAGAPIPAVVPLPGKAMAPMPGKVTVRANDANGDGIPESSQALVLDRSKNPGYPFWIAGIEDTVGQRPPSPPLDMITMEQAQALKDSGDPLWQHPGLVAGAGGHDGGLPRHTLEGYAAGGTSLNVQNRLDMTKIVTAAKPKYFPEEGTDLEQLAMDFHSKHHASYAVNMDGSTPAADFRTNKNLPVPSGPFFEPCRDDNGDLFVNGSDGRFFSADGGMNFVGSPEYGAEAPRVYKGANIQIDAVLNKVGYHFSQQRIIALWEDVMPTINKQRPPEPFVMRANTFDCVKYLHTNLIPEIYELDDYQVRTPTDIIGQHIHLPKWDLVANDGSGNGFNYEDGTLSPGAVYERIEAINHFNDLQAPADRVLSGAEDANGHLHPKPHPFFGPLDTEDPVLHRKPWMGARTTIQRWFTDPIVNADLRYDEYGNLVSAGEDRGLGIVFTHDHYGPSTFQQVGLFSTILAEPAKSKWVHNETGEPLGVRHDGGPTSWQAQILTDNDGDGVMDDGWREFYFEYGDFQHAYEKGVYVGAGPDGRPLVHGPVPVDADGNLIGEWGGVHPDSFRNSINPSFRQQAHGGVGDQFPDILRYPPVCPGGVLRPCAEAISADDIGMLVTNYRSEAVGLRVYDPNKIGPDGKPGTQADGDAGDLGFALQTRIDRAIPELNTPLGDTPYPPLTGGILPGDPYTPLVRAYPGDVVKIKIQSGNTEHEHSASIHGVKWLQGGSGNGAAPNSGWRAGQNDGISEQFTFTMPMTADIRNVGDVADYLYATDSSQDGFWSGMWGIMRTYEGKQEDLKTLPGNDNPAPGRVTNRQDFNGVCPADAPLRSYEVVALLANDVLGNDINATLVPNDPSATLHEGAPVDPDGGTLVYNPRPTQIRQLNLIGEDGAPLSLGGQSGGLHDPTAILYVPLEDLEAKPGQEKGGECRDRRNGGPGVLNTECDVQIKADAPVEPLIVRAAAGECIEVTLHSRLPAVMPDLAGYNTLLQMVNRDRNDPLGLTTFNNNLVRPSSQAGLHPQLVEYDITQHDGANVGINQVQTVGPVRPNGDRDKEITYRWYAGHLQQVDDPTTNRPNDVKVVATPVELGGFNINPADKIKQGQKGMIGGGSIVAAGATWPAALDQTRDHQVNDPMAMRGTRTSTTVTRPDGTNYRDLIVVHQKALNHRFGSDGTAVPNIASEGIGVPEDSHDAGQMAINYGTEPLWFRFGLPADAPFGLAGLGGVQNMHQAFSNTCCDNGGTATTADAGVGDPVTPVFTAAPGQEVQMRLLMPTGSGRGTTFNLHGHNWQRDPYLAGTVPSQTIGDNPLGMTLSAQESVTPAQHFDIVVDSAGGGNGIVGDYLYGDQGSFGTTSGLWGILRVE